MEMAVEPGECRVFIWDPNGHYPCCGLVWQTTEIAPGWYTNRCSLHGGPPAPPHCRACGRLRAPGDCPGDCRGDCPSDKPRYEPCCEVCEAQLQYLVERAEFLADLQCVIAEVDGEYRAGLDAGLRAATATAPGPAEEALL